MKEINIINTQNIFTPSRDSELFYWHTDTQNLVQAISDAGTGFSAGVDHIACITMVANAASFCPTQCVGEAVEVSEAIDLAIRTCSLRVPYAYFFNY